MKRITIIGAGVSGMAAAAVLAKNGMDVTVIEKNRNPGGRINVFENNGFKFDMGPSWYWMPEVFESFYNQFGYTASDFYKLLRLDPSYRVFYKDEKIDVPADFGDLVDLFESREKGSGQRLEKFISRAEEKYNIAMSEFVWKPGRSWTEFADFRILRNIFRLQLFNSVSSEVSGVVRDPKLRQILEFPVLFLGAAPGDTPALYTMMNYADNILGSWYPLGGMFGIAEAFHKIAQSAGAHFIFNDAVSSFEYNNNTINSVITQSGKHGTDLVLASADYHHVDSSLTVPELKQYNKSYWKSRKLAPSALLFYLGINRKIPGLLHHNLFFDADFSQHTSEIYSSKKWPKEPLFYVCCPSITDSAVAPEGTENLFILIPVASGIRGETDEVHSHYLNIVLRRIAEQTGVDIKDNIIYKKSFGIKDFKRTYNAYKGNAYGLANTIGQTAIFKPSIKSRKISNLYFTGQLTVPGPGLPPSIISGQMVAGEILKQYHIQ